jgi:hypothetical protein
MRAAALLFCVALQKFCGISVREGYSVRTTTAMPDSPPDHPGNLPLSAWRVIPSRDPAFRSAVRSRIDAAERADWLMFARAHRSLVGGILALALIIGAYTGRSEARGQRAHDEQVIATTYVHSLDARWMRHPEP